MSRGGKYLCQLEEAFWAKSKDDIIIILEGSYEELRTKFAEPLIAKLTAENHDRVLFQQVINNQVMGQFQDDTSDEVRREKLLNAFDSFVTGESTKEICMALRQMSLAQIQALTFYEAFKSQLKQIQTEIEAERLSQTVLISRTSKSWICGRNHKVVHFRNGTKRLTQKNKYYSANEAAKTTTYLDKR